MLLPTVAAEGLRSKEGRPLFIPFYLGYLGSRAAGEAFAAEGRRDSKAGGDSKVIRTEDFLKKFSYGAKAWWLFSLDPSLRHTKIIRRQRRKITSLIIKG